MQAARKNGRAIGRDTVAAVLADVEVRGQAVLVHTGRDRHWRIDRCFGGHPCLTADAVDELLRSGTTLAGVDSSNISTTPPTDGGRSTPSSSARRSRSSST